ncbi:MAG: MFS transporter [Sphingomonadales bacterium]|jgi:GPH family glycoside/pentoside/hexuronide:cation symporter
MALLKPHILYGFLSFPIAISLLSFQVYLPTFLAETGYFSLSLLGGIFFVTRLIDTFSDPLAGYFYDLKLSKNTLKRTFLLIFIPLFLICFSLLIFPSQNIVILFLCLAGGYIFGTLIFVPYYALGAEIEEGYQSHTKFASSRAFFGLIGTIVALIVPSYLFNSNKLESMLLGSFIIASFGFLIGGIFLSEIRVKNRSQLLKPSFAQSFKIFKKKSLFNKLIISQFLNGIANALPATLFILFTIHILKAPEMAGPLLAFYFLSAVVSVPFWGFISEKFKKESCWKVAMIIASIVFLNIFFIDENTLILFIVITFITGFMAGADLTLPVSMLADLIDVDEMETGNRRPSIYFSIWGITSKLTLALAIGVSFPLLELNGGVLGNAKIDEGMLIILYGFLPCLLKLWSVWFLRGYSLSSKEHNKITFQLKSNKGLH